MIFKTVKNIEDKLELYPLFLLDEIKIEVMLQDLVLHLLALTFVK